MPKINLIVNLDDLHRKRELMMKIGALKGVWSVEMKPYSPRRSNSANKFWWAVIVEMYRDFEAQQGNVYDAEMAHWLLKMELLPRRRHVNRNGELIEIPSDSHTLSVEEFSSLIERAIVWLAQSGVVVPDPNDYDVVPVKKGAAKA